MRRIIHLFILVVIVVATQVIGPGRVESGLAASTQQVADKTGLSRAREAWTQTVWPMLSRVPRSIYDGVQYGIISGAGRAGGGISDAFDWLGAGVEGLAASIREWWTGQPARAPANTRSTDNR